MLIAPFSSQIADYLLINQLEVSSMTKRDDKFIVALSNKYSQRLMYVFTFNYWHPNAKPDFSWRAMHTGTPLATFEIMRLRIKIEAVLDDHILSE
jgi:hypothetical protein